MWMPPYAAYALPANAASTRVSASAKPITFAMPSTTTHHVAPRRTHSQNANSQRSRATKGGDVGGHISSKAAANSRVPCGPVITRHRPFVGVNGDREAENGDSLTAVDRAGIIV